MTENDLILIDSDAEKSPESQQTDIELMLIYPPQSRNPVKIYRQDYDRLNSEQYLNDSIIDFYLKFVLNNGNIPDPERYYIFGSFFYRCISDQFTNGPATDISYSRVKKWTRKSDLFEKDFWVIPMAQYDHWNLAIVAHPSQLFKQYFASDKTRIPCIYFFDSLGLCNYEALNCVRRYIEWEWLDKKGEKLEEALMSHQEVIDKKILPCFMPKVPNQENSTDWGVYLLVYAERFMQRPNDFKLNSKDNFDRKDWFDVEEIETTRLQIKNVLLQLSFSGMYFEGVNIIVDAPKRNL